MRAISLHQPWATAIALGAKRVETRIWYTAYRGPLAIHAAKRMVKHELIWLASHWNWCGALRPAGLRMGGGEQLWDLLPFGAVVAVCEVVDCCETGSFRGDFLDLPRRPERESLDGYRWTERQMGNFDLGRFGWVLADVVALRTPIPWKGAQHFFDVPDTLIADALSRMEALGS